MPPEAEQEVIVKRVEEGLATLSETAQSIEAQLQTTTLFRQSILKAAFEGRLVPHEPASASLARFRNGYSANGRGGGGCEQQRICATRHCRA